MEPGMTYVSTRYISVLKINPIGGVDFTLFTNIEIVPFLYINIMMVDFFFIFYDSLLQLSLMNKVGLTYIKCKNKFSNSGENFLNIC